jgi:RNA-directed DNA polymerase
VAQPEERKFLGFSTWNDGKERRIAPRALDKFKTPIRDMTRRTRGISLQRLIEELTPYLIGMARLLRLLPDPACAHQPGSVDSPKIAFVSLAAVAERAKPLQSTAPSRPIRVQSRGRRRFADRVLAHVRTPAVQQALRNHYFDSLGLPPTLCPYPSLTRSNRRST